MNRMGLWAALDAMEGPVRRVFGLLNVQMGMASLQVRNGEIRFSSHDGAARETCAFETLDEPVISAHLHVFAIPAIEPLNRHQIGITEAVRDEWRAFFHAPGVDQV